MKETHMVAIILIWVGALNWGLIGLFGFNLVHAMFGSLPMLESVVYVLVGCAGVYEALTHMKNCKVCTMVEKKKKK